MMDGKTWCRVMHKFGQRKKEKERITVPLRDRLSLSPEETSAATGIGLTSIREAVGNGRLVAHKHGRRTIILPDDLKRWLKTLPNAANKLIEPRPKPPPQDATKQTKTTHAPA